MTTKNAPPSPFMAALGRVSWPTALVAVATLAAVVAVYELSKGEDRTETIMVIGLIGTAITTFMAPLLRPPAALLLVVLLPGLSGCAPTALQLHARVYAFAAVTLEGTHASMVSACTALRDDCAGEAACLERARVSCLDVATAQDATRDAVDLYGRVIVAASAAGGDDALLPQLLAALDIAARGWAALGRAYGAVTGAPLPDLPAWAGTLLAAAGGGS